MSVSVPKGGVSFDETGNPVQLKDMENYMQSKSGELLISSEFAKRWSKDGILSVVSFFFRCDRAKSRVGADHYPRRLSIQGL